MVAELTGISASIAEQKSAGITPGIGNSRSRPRWIQTATREPVYSVLDGNCNGGDSPTLKLTPSLHQPDNVFVISAVKNSANSSDKLISGRKISDITSVHQRESPYVWLPSTETAEIQAASIPRGKKEREEEKEEEEEEAIYSVVRKPAKIRQRESCEVITRQQELNKWLQTASRQSGPKLCSGFSKTDRDDDDYDDDDAAAAAMFNSPDTAEPKIDFEWQRDREPNRGIPRGVVGLVGPYRVYPDPNERREYILREEELVEDVVDSVSEVAARDEDADAVGRRQAEPHQRAKWRIRDDDEETLVPELPDPLDWKESAEDIPGDDSGWKSATRLSPGRENWKLRESDPNASKTSIILPGKLERAVDVPDGASTVSIPVKANNEHQDKDSLNETGSTAGGAVEGHPSGNPSGGGVGGAPAPASAASSASPPPRSLVSRILARARSPHDLLDHAEPFSQLWVVLSNVYGELVVVVMLAFCLAEVMDTPVPLHSLQGVFLMYLYVGSIAVIISIYLWVLVDSCSSLSGGSDGIGDAELGGASLTRFGSLKRAHISRTRTAPTSFYIRVGALLFGLATLVFNGLEMAMHSMMQGDKCHNEIVFVHPVLHGLFTFLQMHFLFVNSQVLVERFGLAARFGFTHLAATNIAVWARLVIWDSAQEWTYLVHLARQESEDETSPLYLRGFPKSISRPVRDLLGESLPSTAFLNPYQPISDEQILQVVDLHNCLNTNTLGRLWTSSVPFLYPFIVQFSLIAAAVTYVMGQNVGRNRFSHKQKFHVSKELTADTRIGCDGSSKGLFLGILCMVAGIVVIIIFLVVKDDKEFPSDTLSWLTCGTPIGILALSGLMTASGLVQVRQMSVVNRAPAALDGLLSNVALFGVQLYSVFTIVVAACSLATIDEESSPPKARYVVLLIVSILQLVQCCGQSTLIAEASKRCCITRFQMMAKPARQVVTFLLFSNAVLWAFDTVVTQTWLSQELQLRFFGVLAWGVISRIGLPLLVFYRFHSCVLLLEAWNKCYRMPRGEHPLN